MTPTQWAGALFVVGAVLVVLGCCLLAGRREYPAPPSKPTGPARTPIRFECACPACTRAAERIDIGDRLAAVEHDEKTQKRAKAVA